MNTLNTLATNALPHYRIATFPHCKVKGKVNA